MTDVPLKLRDYLDSKEKYLNFPNEGTPLLSTELKSKT